MRMSDNNIALHAIANGGKCDFKRHFQIESYLAIFYRNETRRYHSTAKSLIFITMNKVNKYKRTNI